MSMTIMLNETYGANQEKLVAGLAGTQEVPKVSTNATGSVSFMQITEDLITYVLNVTNLGKATEGGIYVGAEGKNGSLVVSIFKFESPVTNENGTLSQGNITAADLQGPIAGKSLTDMIHLMQSGNTYINVHTEQHPNGEIRGQIGFEGIDESGTTLGQNNETIHIDEEQIG